MNPVTPWMHDRPLRNNNPGDLRPRGQAPEWLGQDTPDTSEGGPVAVFITVAEGWAALGLWCLDARYLRGLKTAPQMIYDFAPSIAHEAPEYAAGVAARVGSRELDLADGATLEALCRAIGDWHQDPPLWTDVEIVSGMRLCRTHWPAFRAARLASALPVPE